MYQSLVALITIHMNGILCDISNGILIMGYKTQYAYAVVVVNVVGGHGSCNKAHHKKLP